MAEVEHNFCLQVYFICGMWQYVLMTACASYVKQVLF